MNIWITSDTHFGHDREFLYGKRGFEYVTEHDAAIINNWNSIVKSDDTVYLLGDVFLGDQDHGIECLKQLNGQIHIICGNHDTDTKIKLYEQCENVVEIKLAERLKYGKHNYFLSHYPTLSGNITDDGCWRKTTWNCCGHSHTQDKFADLDKGPIIHCELDAWNNYPVSIDEIESDIRDFYGIKE